MSSGGTQGLLSQQGCRDLSPRRVICLDSYQNAIDIRLHAGDRLLSSDEKQNGLRNFVYTAHPIRESSFCLYRPDRGASATAGASDCGHSRGVDVSRSMASACHCSWTTSTPPTSSSVQRADSNGPLFPRAVTAQDWGVIK